MESEWTTTAPTYTANFARISIQAATSLVREAIKRLPITPSSKILDVGAGTGAVTLTIAPQFQSVATDHALDPPANPVDSPQILAVDISSAMMSNIVVQSLPRVTTQTIDARHLVEALPPSDQGSYTHVFSLFMLQVITTPTDVLCETFELLRPGTGLAGIGIWGRHLGPIEIWERAAKRVLPGYTLPAPFDDIYAWRTKEELSSRMAEAGFVDTHAVEETYAFPFDSPAAFADFWFGAKNPAAVACLNARPGGMEAAEIETRMEVMKEVKEAWDDGKAITTQGVLGVGQRP